MKKLVHVLAGLAFGCNSADAADFTGHWEGAIRHGEAESPFSITADQSGAVWSMPQSGWRDYPFSSIEIDEDKVTLSFGTRKPWTIKGAFDDHTFTGTFLRDDFEGDVHLTKRHALPFDVLATGYLQAKREFLRTKVFP